VLSFAGLPPTPRDAAIAPSPPAFFFRPAAGAGTGGGAGEADLEVSASRGGSELEAGVMEEESGPNKASSDEVVGSGLTRDGVEFEVDGFSEGCKAK